VPDQIGGGSFLRQAFLLDLAAFRLVSIKKQYQMAIVSFKKVPFY